MVLWIAFVEGGARGILAHPGDTAKARAEAMRASGVRVIGVYRDDRAACGAHDDDQGLCSHCQGGTGRHVCQRCQSSALVAGLGRSVLGGAA